MSLFFFNNTTTTEIYTYCHTLSHLDALPNLHRRCGAGRRCGTRRRLWGRRGASSRLDRRPLRGDFRRPVADGGPAAVVAVRRGLRSEEHTSELQSLMRISYAVFCLKQKRDRKRPRLNSRIYCETHIRY